MDIYVKADKKLDTTRRILHLKDFADVVADDCAAVGNVQVLEIDSQKNALFLVTSADVIRAIKRSFPSARIFNIGEKDTVINFSISKSKVNPAFYWAKIIFVSVILLFGSATAIMSFFTDAEMAKVFENVYHLVFKIKNDRPLILEIPFSIGIATGIIVFYNHFAGLKITADPTPIEIEMSLYEDDISKTIIDTLSSDSEDENNA